MDVIEFLFLNGRRRKNSVRRDLIFIPNLQFCLAGVYGETFVVVSPNTMAVDVESPNRSTPRLVTSNKLDLAFNSSRGRDGPSGQPHIAVLINQSIDRISEIIFVTISILPNLDHNSFTWRVCQILEPGVHSLKHQ